MAQKINDGLTPQERYRQKTLAQFILRFNRNTDADILAHLETIDNFQGYIKRLIRADIARKPPADD